MSLLLRRALSFQMYDDLTDEISILEKREHIDADVKSESDISIAKMSKTLDVQEVPRPIVSLDRQPHATPAYPY